MSPPAGSLRLLALCLLPFALAATMNSAGYRFGASDQAFYAPAMLKAIDPSLYPRDSPLIRSQARLTLVDDIVGPLLRASSIPLPAAFAAMQLAALALLAAAALSIGGRLYRTEWAAVALLAALSLRHAISKSGTNTLEGYFHPRQLAFGLGALAAAAFLRGHLAWPAALVLAAGMLHPTTALWFLLWLCAAVVVRERERRHMLALAVAAAAIAVVAAGWALSAGPLQGRLTRMDPEWLDTLAAKDYLFPLRWPAATWLINLAYLPIIVWTFRRRQRAGLAIRGEAGLVAGCAVLVAVFLALLPFNAARIALAIQLQPARIFWLLDFFAVVYAVWGIAEGLAAGSSRAGAAATIRARAAAAALIVAALARGSYVMFVEFPERRIVQASMTDDDWGRAMSWARASEAGSGWLAHPEHAVRYGTSVRVAGQRDVFVEAIKDGAVGMYDRAVALRTRDRVRTLGDFDALSAARAQSLAREYDLDYLVTEQPLDLPEAFRSGALRIYRLR
jgi:hypothetical protein